jgi:TonB family protein
MKHIVAAILLLSFFIASGQSREVITAYFDRDWLELRDSVNARFYRTVEETGDAFIVRDYYISGKLQMVAECSQATPKMIFDGKRVLYYENGVVQEEGLFEESVRSGIHKFFYESGKPKAEILYQEKDQRYHYYLSEDGQDLIPNGNGFVQGDSKRHRQFTEIENFVAIALFSVEDETNDTVYTSLNKLPEYGGGYEQLGRDISARLTYPKSARRLGIEGTVYVQFIVDKTGGVTACNVIKGVSAACDAEAVAAVSALQRWEPGIHHGRAVRTRFVLPVKFKLKG